MKDKTKIQIEPTAIVPEGRFIEDFLELTAIIVARHKQVEGDEHVKDAVERLSTMVPKDLVSYAPIHSWLEELVERVHCQATLKALIDKGLIKPGSVEWVNEE